MNKFTLRFDSEEYETGYRIHFLKTQLRVHKIDIIVGSLVIFFTIIFALQDKQKDYLFAKVSFICIKIAQYFIVEYYDSKFDGVSLVISNFVLSLIEGLFIFPRMGSTDEIQLVSMLLNIVHFPLMIYPDFLLSAFTIIGIVGIKIYFVQVGIMVIQSIALILIKILFVGIQYERNYQQRLHYIALVNQAHSDEIIQSQLNDGIIITDFQSQTLQFSLTKSNSAAAEIVKVNDSESLRRALRELETPDKQNLELYLFKLIKEENSQKHTITCKLAQSIFNITISHRNFPETRIVLSISPITSQEETKLLKQKLENILKIMGLLVTKSSQYGKNMYQSQQRILSVGMRRYHQAKFQNMLLNTTLSTLITCGQGIRLINSQHTQATSKHIETFNIRMLVRNIIESFPGLRNRVLISFVGTRIVHTNRILVTQILYNLLFSSFKSQIVQVVCFRNDQNLLTFKISCLKQIPNKVAHLKTNIVSREICSILGPSRNIIFQSLVSYDQYQVP